MICLLSYDLIINFAWIRCTSEAPKLDSGQLHNSMFHKKAIMQLPLIAEIFFGSSIFLLFVPVMLLPANDFSSKRASTIFKVNDPGSLEADFTLWRISLESLTPCSGHPMFTSVKKKS